MDWVLNHLESEFYMIEGAPIIFGFTCVLLSVLIYWVLGKYIYGPQLEARDATIKAKDSLIDLYKRQLELASAMGSKKMPTEFATPTSYTLSEERYAILVQSLANQEIERYVGVYVSPEATENRRFAIRIKDAAGEAGWVAHYLGDTNLEGYQSGIWIIPAHKDPSTPATSEVLREALISAGIPARVDLEKIAPATWLIVGRKEAEKNSKEDTSA